MDIIPLPAGTPPEMLERLRAAADESIEKTSLRDTAREIGMSPSGLRRFVEGAAPYAKTLRRLKSWYVRQSSAEPANELTGQEALAALHLLTNDLPREARDRATAELLEVVAQGYDLSGRPRPEWMAMAARRFAPRAEPAAPDEGGTRAP